MRGFRVSKQACSNTLSMTATDLRAKLFSVIIMPLMTLMLAVALLVFVYGLFQFMMKLSSGGDTKEGKNHMLWGIVGFVIMTAAYAILQVILNTFGITLPSSGSGAPTSLTSGNNTGAGLNQVPGFNAYPAPNSYPSTGPGTGGLY